MTRKYTIFQVDDSRQHYVDNIRGAVLDWTEVKTKCIDGRDPGQLLLGRLAHPYEVIPSASYYFPRVGHLGIWYTVLNALEHAPIVTFEDDAILDAGPFFTDLFEERIAELPDDADFFSLFLPRDSDHMFRAKHEIGKHFVCRAYQPYGGVSMFYTEKGAERIKALLERDGIYHQYDNMLYNYSWHGELNGYTSKPQHPDLVRITGNELSIVQETDLFD